MVDVNPAAYRGDPGVPHANEDSFIVLAGGVIGCFGFRMFSDFLDVRTTWTPDAILAIGQERARRRARLKGEKFVPLDGNHPDKAVAKRAEVFNKWAVDFQKK